MDSGGIARILEMHGEIPHKLEHTMNVMAVSEVVPVAPLQVLNGVGHLQWMPVCTILQEQVLKPELLSVVLLWLSVKACFSCLRLIPLQL